MSITIETSDNREYFKKRGYDRFYDFYTQYIPKHLPEWGTPDENGLQLDWRESVQGYVSIIDYSVDDAIDKIIERPEDKVVQFHLKALKNTIDLWTPEWDKEFAMYAITKFYSVDASQVSDAYMTLYTMAYMNDEESKAQPQSLSTYTLKWVSEKSLDSVLYKFQPLAPLFSKSPLECFKTAFTSGAFKEAENSLEPSFKNLLAVHFLIFHLIKKGFVAEVPNMDGVISVLTGKKTSYRKSKYKFENEDYALTRDKENLVLNTIDSLSQ